MNKPIIVLGGGGHASVLIDLLLQQRRQILGVLAPDVNYEREVLQGIQQFTCDCDISQFHPKEVELVNGIGSLPGDNGLRRRLFEEYYAKGYSFSSVIAENSYISKFANLKCGCQILPGAIIQAGAKIGVNTIINSGVIIEHDCDIGEHNHIAPGATLSGQVHTGNSVHIGTGANVIQCIRVGDNAIIGAGTVVTKPVLECQVLYAAKPHIKNK